MPSSEPVVQSEIAEAVEAAARQREVDEKWKGHASDHFSHDKLHSLQHDHEQELSRHAETRLAERNEAHDREHLAQAIAIDKALAEVDKLAALHSTAHAREHQTHEQRHEHERLGIDKAEQAMDKRLAGLNEFREELREQSRAFAPLESIDALRREVDRRFADTTKHTDDKYEDNRKRIENIEKGDVKQEGRSLGQGAVVAIIVSAIGLVGTVLGIIIVLSNLATSA